MKDLESLLESATQERLEIEEARRQLNRLPLRAKEEKDALRATIARFEEKHDWTSLAQVALIRRQTCSCGTSVEWSEGIFLRQSHRTKFGLRRLVHNSWPNCSLPREIEYHDSSTHLCAACAKEWVK